MNRLASWLKTSTEQTPQRLALRTAKGTWTYRELAVQARRGSTFLHENGICSARASPIVAIAGTASDLALAAVACSAADVALLPLDPLTIEARWPNLRQLAGSHARLLSPLPIVLPDQHSDQLATADSVWRDNTETAKLALVIATSGSEGHPKGVMLTRANLDNAAAASNTRLPLKSGDCWLCCLPLHHIGGISTLYRCMRAGATLLLHDGFDATNVWRDLQVHPVTHISLVPAMLARLLEVADGAAPPIALRHALIGGAALSRPLYERARATGWPICPTWGMSECAAQVATLQHPDEHWQEGEVGTLLPGFESRLDSECRIHLRGPQVMAGYLNPEYRLGVGLQNGWLMTSDLGRIDSSGQITLLGRADDVFNSGGIKVHPLEVESCLAACPGVVDLAVTAQPDPVWGDALVALVVGSVDVEALGRWSRQHLTSAQRPRHFLKVDRLPRNTMGKIERSALRGMARNAKERA